MPAGYLALLRGVNVGGEDKLSIKDLVAAFGESGCEHMKGYIQGGNVIFDAAPDVAARLPGAIAYFDTKLATTSTGRNWRTVTRLLGLMRT